MLFHRVLRQMETFKFFHPVPRQMRAFEHLHGPPQLLIHSLKHGASRKAEGRSGPLTLPLKVFKSTLKQLYKPLPGPQTGLQHSSLQNLIDRTQNDMIAPRNFVSCTTSRKFASFCSSCNCLCDHLAREAWPNSAARATAWRVPACA